MMWAVLLWAAAAGLAAAQPVLVPLEPAHDSGRSVTGAFEGWFPNADGTFSILVGYFNRNLKEELDIPIGPGNRIEPGGPDQGQPTHFLPRRQWGVFTVTVPRDFGTRRLTWTLVSNGQTTAMPLDLDPLWEISPFREVGVGNTPPVVRFAEGGTQFQGPLGKVIERTAQAGVPLTLPVWIEDDAKAPVNSRLLGRISPVTLTWSQYRGPRSVVFEKARPAVEKLQAATGFAGTAATTATFRDAGEYMLLLVANDWSGDGGRGFQCCWTTAHVKVTVMGGGER
jgi:hypothetical protein